MLTCQCQQQAFASKHVNLRSDGYRKILLEVTAERLTLVVVHLHKVNVMLVVCRKKDSDLYSVYLAEFLNGNSFSLVILTMYLLDIQED